MAENSISGEIFHGMTECVPIIENCAQRLLALVNFYNIRLYLARCLYRLDQSRSIPDIEHFSRFFEPGEEAPVTDDAILHDLGKSGAAALNFRTSYLPMTFVADELRPLIQGQINPVVEPVAGNPVGLTTSYIAYGGCQIFNKFDAVEATTLPLFSTTSGPRK